MPIYEYECTACHHRLESFQKMSDAPLKECPECNRPALQKLISAAGFQLKGTGWYATDFRNKGKPTQDPNKETKSADNAQSKKDTKTDTTSGDKK